MYGDAIGWSDLTDGTKCDDSLYAYISMNSYCPDFAELAFKKARAVVDEHGSVSLNQVDKIIEETTSRKILYDFVNGELTKYVERIEQSQ